MCRLTFASLAILVVVVGCGDEARTGRRIVAPVAPDDSQVVKPPKADTATGGSTLSSKHLDMLRQIRDVAQTSGLRHGALLAGIAFAETGLAHCWSDATWACQGPHSHDCGGPVTAGAGDGPCSLREGGLGMFQFDAGTFDQTLSREGQGVLTIQGNITLAVDFVANMLINTRYVSVSNRTDALQWLSQVRPDTPQFDTWIKTVTHHFNGCEPGYCSIYEDRFAHYAYHARRAFDEVPERFWETQRPDHTVEPSTSDGLSDLDAIEIWWSREDDGRYSFKSIAPERVKTVRYLVDGHILADHVSRDDPDTSEVENNFPAQYDFSTEKTERNVEVLGIDSDGRPIARGIGLIDVVPGTGVGIRQLGPSIYQIGFERAPEDVDSVSVSVDGITLTDAITGQIRSTRLAVRTTFTRLGSRTFVLLGYTSNGVEIVRSERTFTLQ